MEIKRLLKTRSVVVLAVIALVLSLAMAIIAVLGEYSIERASDTEWINHYGLDSIAYERERVAAMEGDVTLELLEEYDQFAAAIEPYGPAESDWPIEMQERYDNSYSDNPIYTSVGGKTQHAAEYYEQRKADIWRTVRAEYGPAAADAALAIDESAEYPFYYEYGFGSSGYNRRVMVQLGTVIFALAFICSIVSIPVFSDGRVSNADTIFKCTKYGRGKLARTRILTAFTLWAVLYLVCAAAFCAIILVAYGPDRSSMQLIAGSHVLGDVTMNGCLALCVLSGLLSSLAMSALVMFLSTHIRSPLIVLAVVITVEFLPILLTFWMNHTQAGMWVRLLLPNSGAGFVDWMYTELFSLDFLTLGSIALWTPFVMLAAPVIETPVFALLAKRAYVRHEA